MRFVVTVVIALFALGPVHAQEQGSYDVKDLVSDYISNNSSTNVLTNGNRKPYLLRIDVCESKV
jgi:hypothetical protein